MCGSISTLAEIHASCLERNAARVFWAAKSIMNWNTAIGADAENVFTKAADAAAPLSMFILTISSFMTGIIINARINLS